MDPIRVTSLLDMHGWKLSRQWSRRGNGKLQWLWPVAAVIFLALGIWVIKTRERDVLGFYFLILGIWAFCRKWVLELWALRLFLKSGQLDQHANWQFDEKGFHVETENASSHANWAAVHQSFTTPDGFLIYPQKGMYCWIARQRFASDQDFQTLAGLLRDHARNHVLK